MTYRISLLDKVLVPEGASAAEALQNTVALARRAEELGYHRLWFAEHHGFARLASSSPETVAAFVLAATKTIRVGSGGVMLQHYAPYKVAETFNTLAALAPGRVDLGIGKAPGGLPLSSRALRQTSGDHDAGAFVRKLEELESYLSQDPTDANFGNEAAASPAPSVPPERILLGASVDSAELAARLGWKFCYAGHFDSDSVRIASAFDAYRKATGASPYFSVVGYAGKTAEAAQALVGPLRLYRVRLGNGQQVNLPTLDAAAEYARQSGVSDYETEEIIPNVISGTADYVRGELDALHARFGIEEFIIDSPVAGYADRLASLEALAPNRAAAPGKSIGIAAA